MLLTILAGLLIFGSGLAMGTAFVLVSPEGALCLLMVAFGTWERWEKFRARRRRA